MNINQKIGAIIINNGKVLIFKEKLEGNSSFLYNIVKGTLKENELIIDGLKREIFEETNLKNIKKIIPFKNYYKFYSNKISHLLVFVVEIDDIKNLSNKNIENNENIKDYKWVEKKDFLNLQEKDFIDKRIYNVLKDYYNFL